MRAVSGLPETGAWAALPIELGGGLELGAPIDDRFSIGVFIDARAVARLPFEREDASLGIGWSAGLACLWF